MKNINIHLPDLVFARALEEASLAGMEVTAYCTGVLSDCLLAMTVATPPVEIASASTIALEPTVTNASNRQRVHRTPTGFEVAATFPSGFPGKSIDLAQTFVDTALALPGVVAFKKGRGIGFEPNFVFIERLLSKGGRAGVGVSFYGQPERHKNPPSLLRKGIPSYSRAVVESEEDLALLLPHVRQSYELKFGPPR